jgi:hypothetical protein
VHQLISSAFAGIGSLADSVRSGRDLSQLLAMTPIVDFRHLFTDNGHQEHLI